MLARCLSLCYVMLFLNPPAAPAGQWHSGIIHVHTTFSDGSDNVPQRVELAKKLGYKYIIFTDHYEQIGSPEKVSLRYVVANPGGVDVGFPDYVRNCSEQTQDGSFVAIPGAEIQTIWHAESDTTDASHTLALGSIGTSADDKLIKMYSSPDCQDKVIKWVEKHQMLPVAAHPTLISTKSATITPWEWQRNRYDLHKSDEYAGIRGVEFFNCETAQQNRDALAWYLRLIKEELQKPKDKRRPIFVTSGCDSHGWNDPNDLERWLRVTRVWADDLTSKAILHALADGRSYASARGSYLKETNCLPGGPAQDVDAPTFRFTVALPTRSTSFLLAVAESYGIPLKMVAELLAEQVASTTIVMYRDGTEVPESRITFKGTPTSVKYEWTDKTAAPGEHWYVLSVDGHLVTSPIKLKLTQKATDDIGQIIDFLSKHNKPALVGSVVKTMEQEGYHVASMFYGGTQSMEGFRVTLRGRHDVAILCETRGLSNAEREKQLRISQYSDSFEWDAGRMRPSSDTTMARAQTVLQELLASFTVTSIEVNLSRDFPWTRAGCSEYGNTVIRKLETRIGKPVSREFIWQWDGQGQDDGWHVLWGKPTRYEFVCVFYEGLNQLRAIVESQ